MSVKSESSNDNGSTTSGAEPVQFSTSPQQRSESPVAHQSTPVTDEGSENDNQQQEMGVNSEESSIKSTSEEEDDVPQPFQGIDLEQGDPKTRVVDTALDQDYPIEGDELTRLETNTQLSRDLSRMITNTADLLDQDYGEKISFHG